VLFCNAPEYCWILLHALPTTRSTPVSLEMHFSHKAETCLLALSLRCRISGLACAVKLNSSFAMGKSYSAGLTEPRFLKKIKSSLRRVSANPRFAASRVIIFSLSLPPVFGLMNARCSRRMWFGVRGWLQYSAQHARLQDSKSKYRG